MVPAPCLDATQAFLAQRAQAFPHRVPADAEAAAERILGRQTIADRRAAGRDVVTQRIDDAPIERRLNELRVGIFVPFGHGTPRMT